jgi:hypothetical protein
MMTQHKEDCTWKEVHKSLWHRCGEWEYELIVDEDGMCYKVSYLTGLHPNDSKTHSFEHHDFKFCPVCGVKIEKEEE